MFKVLVCEDQTLVRQALVMLLNMEPSIQVIGEAVDGTDALEKVAQLRPDVALMDLQMPVMDGVEATRTIAIRYPETRVIILTTHGTEEYVLEGVKAGAMAYVLKDSSAPELVETIKRVCEGEQFIQPAVASKILFELARLPQREQREATYEALTEREIAIISRLANGMSNREIADDLGLAEGTVRNYTSNILTKLHAANRVQAINLARERKII